MREGAMVQTPTPPTETGRKLGAAERLVEKETGRRRRIDGLGDGDTIFGRPAVEALTVRSAIGSNRILLRTAIAALTVRPAITALTGY